MMEQSVLGYDKYPKRPKYPTKARFNKSFNKK